MPLQAGLQLVVQHPVAGQGGTCRGFTGLPTTSCAWILIEALHPSGFAAAEALGNAIADSALRLGSNALEVAPPCGGNGFGHCHAENQPDCVKLRLLVADTRSIQPAIPPVASAWSSRGPKFVDLPVLVGSTSVLALPSSLAGLNALRWTPGDLTGPLDVLRTAGITAERRRVFISYVRADCDRLAEQVFDGLSKRGFDVFVDRFRLEPGIDFQVRLNEELGRMGTVLVLESKGVRRSTWVQYEVNFARKHGLAILALNLPGGHKVPGVSALDRLPITTTAFKKSGVELKRPALADVVTKIESAHARTERTRAAYMRDNVSRTLARQGWLAQAFDPSGNVIARRKVSEHAFRVCSLPAELSDFRSIDRFRSGRSGVAVIAPASSMSWRTREPVDWLSQRVGTELVDPADFPSFLKGLP